MNSILLKLRGAEQWPEHDAVVHSCDWNPPSGESGGTMHLVYSYRAGGEYQSGKAWWWDEDGSTVLHKDEALTIRVNPKDSSQSWFPDKQDLTRPFVVVGVTAGVILIVILFGAMIRS